MASKFASLCLIGLTAFGVSFCGPQPTPESADVKQITKADLPCIEYSTDAIDSYLKDLPKDMLPRSGWTDAHYQRARNAMTGIPKVYLDWLAQVHKENGFKIVTRDYPVSGEARWTGTLPTLIIIRNRSTDADYALQHEIGHQVHVKFRLTDPIPGFEQRLTELFNSDGRSPVILDYAKKSRAEFWAEAFNSYYCSPKAQEFVKDNLPATYNFLATHLAPPRWVEETPEVSKDIYLAFSTSRSDTPIAALAASSGVVQAGICLGGPQQCKTVADIQYTFEKTHSPFTNRAMFKSSKPLNPTPGERITLLGFSEQGKMLQRQTVALQPRS